MALPPPIINCSVPGCKFVAPGQITVAEQIELLKIHSTVNHPAPQAAHNGVTTPTSQPLPVSRPVFSLNMTEAAWQSKEKEWHNYTEQSPHLPESVQLEQLRAACDESLRQKLTDCEPTTTAALLDRMRELTRPELVHRVRLLQLVQQQEEDISGFVARLRAAAQLSGMNVRCHSCPASVSYKDEVLKTLVVNGMYDGVIKQQVLGRISNGELATLSSLVEFISTKEKKTGCSQPAQDPGTDVNANDDGNPDFKRIVKIKTPAQRNKGMSTRKVRQTEPKREVQQGAVKSKKKVSKLHKKESCPHCSLLFTPRTLDSHISVKHPDKQIKDHAGREQKLGNSRSNAGSTFKSQKVKFNCELCPRAVGKGRIYKSRTHLYNHFCLIHFKKDLIAQLGQKKDQCPECPKRTSNLSDLLKHLGVTHEKVDDYLEEQFRIPKRSVQKKLSNPELVKPNAEDGGDEVKNYLQMDLDLSTDSSSGDDE